MPTNEKRIQMHLDDPKAIAHWALELDSWLINWTGESLGIDEWRFSGEKLVNTTKHEPIESTVERRCIVSSLTARNRSDEGVLS